MSKLITNECMKSFISNHYGKVDISDIGGGTATSAIRTLNDNLIPVVYDELQEKTFTTAEWAQGTGGSTWTCPEDGLYYVNCYFMGAVEDASGNLTIYKHQLLLWDGQNDYILSEYGTNNDSGWRNLMPTRLLSAIVPIIKGTIIHVNVHTSESGRQIKTKMWIVRLRKGYNDVIKNYF